MALRFQSEADAKAYSQRTALKEKLQHYRDMENKSTATATDITAVDNEAVQNVNDYIRALAQSDLTGASTAAQEMNDTFTRRQMMIGTSIDFAALKKDLQSQMDDLGTAEPIGSVTTAVSGVFSGYTDGCESVFDFDQVTEMTAADLDKALKTAESAKGDTGALGKVITSYAWYFVCKADVADLQKVQNGTRLDVAIKDSDRVLSCTVVSGADTKPGATQTVLVLQCENMDSDIAAYRAEDIEIRTASYTGIKAPAAAVHVSGGKKGVYVLVAGQVKFRPATVLYSGKDYVILAYDAQNKDGIRLYDEIITEGRIFIMEKFIPDPARLQAVEENWKRVLDRVQEGAVKSGRDPREVRLMAVTKTVEPVYINRALDLGADLIGENRVQEYLGKRDELHLDGVEKHLIGRLQTNKVKYIVGQVDMIQSVDSMKLAQEISKQSVKHGVTTQVLVEVNIGREESKSGIMIEALPELLEEAAQLPGLQIKGLMCIPPFVRRRHRYANILRQCINLSLTLKTKNTII